MINLEAHGINPNSLDVTVNDLIALANIRSNSVDSRVLQDQGTHIVVSGNHEKVGIGTYAVVGGEVVRITAVYTGYIPKPEDPDSPLPPINPPPVEPPDPNLPDNGADPDSPGGIIPPPVDPAPTLAIYGTFKVGNVLVGKVAKRQMAMYGFWGNYTLFRVQRAKQGTKQEDDGTGMRFRTVVLAVDQSKDMTLTDWSFEDSIGGVTNNLFPCELSSGSISLISDLSLWSPHDLNQKYKVRPNKSIAYIFKGVGEKRVLKFTTTISKVGFNTRGKKEPNKIKLDIKNRLSQWYDKDLAVNQQLKGIAPKEFLRTLFELEDYEVYYANGVDESSFIKIANLHTKEYKKYSEILKAYCSNGVRFCFDSKERIKIFSDFKVDNIESMKTVEYNITNSMLSEDDHMIYNTIDTKVTQRLPMYNFEDLNNRHVEFYKVLNNIVNSNAFLTRQSNGEVVVNGIDIVNEDLHQSVQLKDYVLFKRTTAPYLEFYAMVIAIEKGNKVSLMPMLYDKDYKLLQQGKAEYLFPIMVNNSCPMNLYYVREELPMIFKYTRNKDGEERDSSLMYPVLPRVDGETKYEVENLITFGSASNLKVGSYTGIIEEVEGIYGMWEQDKLLYNMEKSQFSNSNYPPIFALSNRVEEKVVTNPTGSSAFLLNYTHFDNSGLRLTIEKPRKPDGDAILKIANTISINSNIDIHVGEEVGRVGNKILEVTDIINYKIGDVLIVNKPDDATPMEEAEFDEVLSAIKWTVIAKESQRDGDGWKHYIFVDSNFPVRNDKSKKYKFTRFPNWSIVYLQELYFRGNPIIEHTQDVSGVARGVNVHGERSTEVFGEKKYTLESKQLDKEGLKMMMGYILDNFQSTSTKTSKFNAPVSVFNGIDIELLDVITVEDPMYTKINSDMKWLVVSVTNKARTNEVQLKLLNINSENTKPWKIDIKDVIEYAPVEIPKYDHAGGEGNTDGNDDGTGGSNEDKSLGQFWLAEIDPKIFRAKVEKFEGNYIYFKDFAGEEWELYASKLFPQTEFGVSIDGEIMFIESDMNYRAFIKKRCVYDSNETVIQPEMDVKFYVVTTHVDIDGTFYSRKVHIGDGDTYFDFHPVRGAQFVGDFVIGAGGGGDLGDLAEDMNDVNQGKIVINGNTTFNGDATIVSKGTNETTEIRGGSITFTRNGSPISVIRNTRYGTANITNGQPVIITLTGFKGTAMILPSIREFNFSENTKSVECSVETVNQVNQQYRLYLRGVETVVQGEVDQGTKTNSYTQANVLTMRCSDINTIVNTNMTKIRDWSVGYNVTNVEIQSIDYISVATSTVSAYNGQSWNVVGTREHNFNIQSYIKYHDGALFVDAMSLSAVLNEQSIRSYSGALATLGLSVTTTINVVVNSIKAKLTYWTGSYQGTTIVEKSTPTVVGGGSTTTFRVYTATRVDVAVSGNGKVQYIAIEE